MLKIPSQAGKANRVMVTTSKEPRLIKPNGMGQNWKHLDLQMSPQAEELNIFVSHVACGVDTELCELGLTSVLLPVFVFYPSLT